MQYIYEIITFFSSCGMHSQLPNNMLINRNNIDTAAAPVAASQFVSEMMYFIIIIGKIVFTIDSVYLFGGQLLQL